jgi:hypothetical protein
MKINCKDNLLSLSVESTVRWLTASGVDLEERWSLDKASNVPAMFPLQIRGRDLVERGILFGGESRKPKGARTS